MPSYSPKPASRVLHNLTISILRLCLCIIIAVAFVLCIAHEFTFILNYTTSVTPFSSLQDFLKSTNAWKESFRKSSKLEEDWIRVTDGIFVYSAYWDTRYTNESFVRIIGAAKRTKGGPDVVKCLLRYNNSIDLLEIPTNITFLQEHHNKPAKAFYIKCLKNTDESPSYAAVVPVGWNETWSAKPSWLRVHAMQNYSNPSIGVCVRPMFNYSDVFRISEFVAYYEALGASHFTFYVFNVSEDIIKYLQVLKAENYSLSLLPWSLPSEVEKTWALGQVASINDCLYRNLGKNMYIVIVDLDEFMTPTQSMTLQEVLEKEDLPARHAASFVVRSCIFCAEYKPDVLPSVIPPFKTQSDIYRESYTWPFMVRSKYIAKPFMVETAGVHNVWEFIPGWGRRFVSVKEAIVHHYRGILCVNGKALEKAQIDVKSRKYLNSLMRSKAVYIWEKMFYTNH